MVLYGRADVALESSDPASCIELARQAWEIHEAAGSESLEAQRPRVAVTEALLEQSRFAEALPILHDIWSPSAKGPPFLRAVLLELLGRAYVGLHQPDLAVGYLEQAVLSADVDPDVRKRIADANFWLAKALSDLHRDPKRARALAAAALDILDKAEPLSPLRSARRDEIRAWIAQHG
jgi:hypothetical protein